MSFTPNEARALNEAIELADIGHNHQRDLWNLVHRETSKGEDLTLRPKDIADHILSPVPGRPLSVAELAPLARDYLKLLHERWLDAAPERQYGQQETERAQRQLLQTLEAETPPVPEGWVDADGVTQADQRRIKAGR